MLILGNILYSVNVHPCLIHGFVLAFNLHKIFNKSIMTFYLGGRAPMKVGERAPTEVEMFEVEMQNPNTE